MFAVPVVAALLAFQASQSLIFCIVRSVTTRDMTTIYIPLVAEGTAVWRPAQAEHIREDIYRITGEVPTEEVWQFQPGELVRTREQRLSNVTRVVAYENAA